jgi:hypothetical protein
VNRSCKRLFQMEPIHRTVVSTCCLDFRVLGPIISSGLLLLLGLDAPHAQERGQILEVSTSLCEDMKRAHVLNPNSPLGCDRLKLVRFDYFGFDGNIHHDGEVMVMDAAAENVLNVFKMLVEIEFPVAKARLLNAYDGNDDASMADNNTSAFNDRRITGGDDISLHAYGLALDINPIQNPYVNIKAGELEFSPPPGIGYVDRLNRRPGMAESVIGIFANNGFMIWGGDWSNPVDYQHFQVERSLAKELARLTPQEAKTAFDLYVVKCRNCLRTLARSECVRQRSLNQIE